jgi:hypothetical protein
VSFARLIAVVLLVSVADGVSSAAEPEAGGPIAIVVGAESDIHGVTLDTLRELYLRRQRLWPSGESAMPVNLPADSTLRGAFSKRVLGRTPADLESYWRRMYFDGIRPPLVLKTSQAVCAYVATEGSAIGYVRLDAVDRDSCRVLFVLGEEE